MEREFHLLNFLCDEVVDQVVNGKGQRHGGNKTSFMDQPWRKIADTHGRGFLTGQAAKKLDEAVNKTGDAFDQEIFGAVAYMLMAVLYDRARRAKLDYDEE